VDVTDSEIMTIIVGNRPQADGCPNVYLECQCCKSETHLAVFKPQVDAYAVQDVSGGPDGAAGT
jgi:hypothetical protein